ncbi:MAG: UDP-N-acetylmuramate dehydrogenase [Ruminococcaceae bacterium]|nr:UDP-N-acetylmuramate dehydrogenase [Oscillospiraceae bacterium]
MERLKEFCEKNGIRLTENEMLSRHTSFRTGGPARYFAAPADEADLAALLKYARERAVPTFIMGNGTNLLAPDEGFDGLVIALGERFAAIRAERDIVTAQAGALLSQVGRFALQQGLTGFEFAHGIPGSVGGGVYMNAGAYGGELKDVTERVRFLDESLELRALDGAQCGFAYRTSAFKSRPGWIVTGADFRLVPGNTNEIAAKMEDLARRRRDKQPLEYPSAGSTFKRPEGYFAAKLIEDAGLKGTAVGGAQVSEKHAGFVINRGGATTGDILRLMELVRETVLARFGVTLEPEVERMRPREI